MIITQYNKNCNNNDCYFTIRSQFVTYHTVTIVFVIKIVDNAVNYLEYFTI